jgi:hypothetical protein
LAHVTRLIRHREVGGGMAEREHVATAAQPVHQRRGSVSARRTSRPRTLTATLVTVGAQVTATHRRDHRKRDRQQ